MAEPSAYEFDAWRRIRQFRGRPLSRLMGEAGRQVAAGVGAVGKRATNYLETHPRAQAVASRGQGIVGRGVDVIGAGARRLADGLPDWSGPALESTRRTLGRVSRAGLSPERVVARHQKLGHDVACLSDLRRLDLEQIDAVHRRGANWYYPALASLSGGIAGLVISGGELVTAVSGGAAAAPSGAVVAGAFVGDAAIVLGLASRAVGQISLLYGYDPEAPEEKLFVMSVVNAGSATSAGAKTAAMADVSRLTQALIRGKVWRDLDRSLVTQVVKEFAKLFGIRITKQGLGKVVPTFGIAIGGTFNWTNLESIVDAADVVYRRRFLLEKYPQLGEDGEDGHGVESVGPPQPPDNGTDDGDETISVLEELAKAGGPDLRDNAPKEGDDTADQPSE